MEEKVVLITGASRGIGSAIAKKMASLHYHIVLNYFHSELQAQKLKEELERQYAVKVLLIRADVSVEEDVKNMLNFVKTTFGRIDCIVNNAAICRDCFFEEKTVDEFHEVLDTNLIGPFLMCKYFGKFMFEQKFGKIINISSTNGIDTNEPYSIDYDASKAGLISLTKNFAKALAPYVLVNTIAPGWVNTEPVQSMNPVYAQEEKEKILLKRFAEAEEIANVVAFLASDEASYINNSIIRVDGGIL